MSYSSKLQETDVTKLMMGGYKVEMINEDEMNEFYVSLHGPPNRMYLIISFFSFLDSLFWIVCFSEGCHAGRSTHMGKTSNALIRSDNGNYLFLVDQLFKHW